MRHNDRHNPNKVGSKRKSGRMSKFMRGPLAFISGLILLTTGIDKFNTYNGKPEDVGADKTRLTTMDAMNAVLVANYGENYQRGMYPELDQVVDTATTSKGLLGGVDELLGEKLDVDLLYAKMVVKDEEIANDLYQMAFAGLRQEINKPTMTSSKIQQPLKRLRISSGFGYRRHPTRGGTRHHNGVDFRAVAGTPVYNSMRGIMAESRVDGSNVGTVMMDGVDENGRRNGWRFLYLHVKLADRRNLGRIFEAGEQITTIARQHQYGYEPSTGTHLHYEIHRYNPKTGKYALYNPQQMMRDGYVLQGYKAGKTLSEKMGAYVTNVIKGDVSGDVFAGLGQRIEEDFAAGNISRAEYRIRKDGFDLAVESLRDHAIAMFKKDYQDRAENLLQYASSVMDGTDLPAEKARPTHRPYKPLFTAKTDHMHMFTDNFLYMSSKTAQSDPTTSLRDQVADFKIESADIVVASRAVQGMALGAVHVINSRQAMLVPQG